LVGRGERKLNVFPGDGKKHSWPLLKKKLEEEKEKKKTGKKGKKESQGGESCRDGAKKNSLERRLRLADKKGGRMKNQ